jgi:hypothetical protein
MRNHLPVVAVALCAAALVTGCGKVGGPQPVTGPLTITEPAPIAEPAEVSIPKIGAHSSLVGLALNDDESVEVPPVTAPMQAGWFAGGPKPGERGPR